MYLDPVEIVGEIFQYQLASGCRILLWEHPFLYFSDL